VLHKKAPGAFGWPTCRLKDVSLCSAEYGVNAISSAAVTRCFGGSRGTMKRSWVVSLLALTSCFKITLGKEKWSRLTAYDKATESSLLRRYIRLSRATKPHTSRNGPH
jgi:hypothetical protein